MTQLHFRPCYATVFWDIFMCICGPLDISLKKTTYNFLLQELCFSSDGRLVCSPFGYGARLMSFNGACSDLRDIPSYSSSSSSTSTWQPQIARPLHSVSTLASHSNTVVCTKWSPTHCLFASACLNGKVVFYNPVFWTDMSWISCYAFLLWKFLTKNPSRETKPLVNSH